MSVTTHGIQGYEYQYKASVLIGLLTLPDSSELLAEAAGSEDVKVKITSAGQSSVVEIQVKKTTTPVDVAILTDWLCHFPERSAKENLLSRIADTNNTALIITTARCLDSASPFVKKTPEISAHVPLTLDSGWMNAFADALHNNGYTGTTKLQKERDQFCKDLGQEVKNSTRITDALKRIIIWEELSPVDLDNTIEQLLNKKYQIPQSMVAETVGLLEAAVRKGRDQKANISPEFVRILHQQKGEGPLTDTRYHARKEESGLLDGLEKKGTLLLSGQSQCGKSEIAKKIAERYYQQGAAFKIADEVGNVTNFFNLNSTEDKICILEDPWGHISAKENYLDISRKIEFLIRNKRPNHRLIITSREEILKTVSDHGAGLSSTGFIWNNITITHAEEIKALWNQYAAEQKLAEGITNRINTLIDLSSKTSLLQIGELQHLSKYDSKIEQLSDDELLHIARQDSVAIAADLLSRNASAAELLAVLSQLGDTIIPVCKADLGFVLSDDTTTYSILPDSVFISGGSSKPAGFPTYKQPYTLLPELQTALEYLEDRGFIALRNERIQFTHPNYYEAGRRILITGNNTRQSRLLNYFRKALSCLSPASTLHATKQLGFLSSLLPEGRKPQSFEFALLACNSILPAVRDQGLIFLARNASVLPSKHKHDAEEQLNSGDIPSSHIFWHDDIAYISSSSDFWARDLFFSLPEDKFKETSQKFERDESVSSLQAWNFVRALATNKSRLAGKAANNLMQYDEVFIRKKAAKLMVRGMTVDSDLDLNLLRLCFGDPHPSVVFAAVETILLNWKDWDPKVKPALRELLINSQKDLAVSIRSNRFLITFQGDEDYQESRWEEYDDAQKKEIWNQWAELYVEMIKNLPPHLFFDAVGFGETIHVARGYMTEANGLAVFNSWYQRIDLKINAGFILDEYEMCIADELIAFTKMSPGSRLGLMEKLLSYSDTSFLISSLKWSISEWESLTEQEKSIILTLLQSARADLRWIKSIAICRHTAPPPEIQRVLLGDEHFFDLPPSEFIAKAPRQLLEDALKMYFGHPQPLYWLATQGNNEEFWQAITRQVLHDFTEPFFSISLRQLTSMGLNGFSKPWKDSIALWEHVCLHHADKKQITERIIYDTSRINCSLDTAKKMYDILINAWKVSGMEDELVELIAEKIELLQQTGHGAQDLVKILDPSFFHKVYSRLMPDAQLYLGAQALKADPATIDTFQPMLKTITKNDLSFRFELTAPIIKKILSSLPIPPSLADDIDRIPNRIDSIGKEEKEAIRSKDEYRLDNWYGI